MDTDLQPETRKALDNRDDADFWQIADFLPAMIMYKDTHNNILRLNRGAASMMGLPVTAVEGNSCYDLNPDEADAYYADDMQVITSGQPKTGIVEPLETVTEGKRWLRTDKYPYRDGTGKTIGVVLFALDITEAKRTEDALAEAKDQLRAQADSLDRTGALLHTSLQHLSELVSRGATHEELAAYIESVRQESAQPDAT